jgi:hypothetical protein
MSSEASSFERTGDIEDTMRRSLGLDTGSVPASVPSQPIDPLRGARQAIRSQAAAREYVERQLAHAEATIQALRNKLHHARRDKDAAIEAARSAAARRVIVERALIVTESALATEKAARDRGDRALRETQATISHLQAKLDAAAQSLETAKIELTAERQARQKAEDGLRKAKTATQIAAPATDDEPAVLQMTAQPMRKGGRSLEVGNVAVVDACPEEGITPRVQRPVGRPRKTKSTPPVQASPEQARKMQAPTKAISPKVRTARPSANDHAPIQWWVEGWRGKRA